MSRLEWALPENRIAQNGLDRGVLYPNDSDAVVWDGLISVTESGNQTTSTYYVDGRAYLSVATPREYSGKITAFTFPDEFAAICGIEEAADGLFLDSQVPDSFGLSYRTGYTDGENYKIHLLYGVTAAVSDAQFQTLSDSNSDPTNFEFDIVATPQQITGYRPTAHAIIDTRNLDADKIYQIENLLYGYSWEINPDDNNQYESTEPHLPSLNTLFEIMNFGDIVKITDNGDGTWMAEGSYKYITVNPDGTFTIENVTATAPDADGKYLVASTDEDITTT